MRTKMVIQGRVCHIVMTRRANDSSPIEYQVRYEDNGEFAWVSPNLLLYVF